MNSKFNLFNFKQYRQEPDERENYIINKIKLKDKDNYVLIELKINELIERVNKLEKILEKTLQLLNDLDEVM
jgi:hypothetical protein